MYQQILFHKLMPVWEKRSAFIQAKWLAYHDLIVECESRQLLLFQKKEYLITNVCEKVQKSLWKIISCIHRSVIKYWVWRKQQTRLTGIFSRDLRAQSAACTNELKSALICGDFSLCLKNVLHSMESPGPKN